MVDTGRGTQHAIGLAFGCPGDGQAGLPLIHVIRDVAVGRESVGAGLVGHGLTDEIREEDLARRGDGIGHVQPSQRNPNSSVRLGLGCH